MGPFGAGNYQYSLGDAQIVSNLMLFPVRAVAPKLFPVRATLPDPNPHFRTLEEGLPDGTVKISEPSKGHNRVGIKNDSAAVPEGDDRNVSKMLKKTALFVTVGLVLILNILAIISSRNTRLSPETLSAALAAHARFKPIVGNRPYIIIIDYGLPVFKKRLWILESATQKVILNAHVAHAWKSGFLYATDLSNTLGSKQSFQSKFGLTMRVSGLEKGTNDNAEVRGIWFHASYFPWTWGCFATFPGVNKKIITLAQNKAFLYVNNLNGQH
jgi:hypothetical protein